jgi:hypothetical protein
VAKSGLENRWSEAHIPVMVTIVRCNCGAEYSRTEEKFLVPHTGDAVCAICGAALESWRDSPTFQYTNLLNIQTERRSDIKLMF